MDFCFETTRKCVSYGSIISFMSDIVDYNAAPLIDYDPANPFSQESGYKKEDYVDILKSRKFLYSTGVFDEFCYLYSFKDKKDIQNNYFNTLFVVLPSCEYDSMIKFKHLIKNLKNEILMDDSISINNQQIIDAYIKFKQEIQSNHEFSTKNMTKDNNKVNFDDSVQFLHIKSGKFLSFRNHDEQLKTYIELTEKASKNTIFRFTSAFDYQTENSTNVYFNMSIQIACGEKNTRNEKYINNIKNNVTINSNINKHQSLNFDLQRKQSSINVKERDKNIRMSLKNIFPDRKSLLHKNFFTYSNNSNLAYKNFGKKLLPEDNYIGIYKNTRYKWRLISFSQNYIKDNRHINFLDYFCIQNIEKNLFIQSVDLKKDQSDEENLLYGDNFKQGLRKKNKNKLELTNSQPLSDKLVDEKEKAPIIPSSGVKSINMNLDESKNESLLKENESQYTINNSNNNSNNNNSNNNSNNNNIELNFNFDENFYSNMNYKLGVNIYNEKDFIDPFGLFKFEIISNENINNDLKTNIKLLSEDYFVRIINVFTNKVISVDIAKKVNKNKYELKLIDNIDITDKRYDKTLFRVEKSNETQNEYIKKEQKKIFGNKNENEDDNNKIDDGDNDDEKLLLKSDFIKLKSKKGNLYIGIRLNNNPESIKELILTKSTSDLTRFKLNFLDEEDKHELHFFEQLLWSLEKILNFFEKEIENNIDVNSYELIQHVLITLEKKIKHFKDNRNVKIVQENKFDFLKIIENFNIVSKLIDLFLANWFHVHDYKNLDYKKFDDKLTIYFNEKKEERKYKQLISKKILKLLTIIYDLDKSYLKVISKKLLYFFMFVGRDDKCTKFLVHILKDNRILLISLCPTNIDPKDDLSSSSKNSESSENSDENSDENFNNSENSSPPRKFYENMKKCLLRIISDYNHLNLDKLSINFSSVFLFFKLMNCLLMYNNQPFMQFYDYYFKELNLFREFKEKGEIYHKSNFEKNPILVDFYKKDGNIYAKKFKFLSSDLRAIVEENYDEDESDSMSNSNKISSSNKIQSGNSTNNNVNNRDFIEYKLNDLIGINNNTNIDKYYKKILFAKLVSLNIFFYSNLALCNPKFKNYLKKLFEINDIIKNYLSINKGDELIPEKKKKPNNLNNDLKCSLIQLLNYLYFRVSFPFWEKINLFKCLENIDVNRSQLELINLNKNEKNIEEEDLDNIIVYVNHIISNSIGINVMKTDPFLLLQIFECTKYILRNMYSFKNKQERIDSIFDLMSIILIVLDKYIGMSSNEEINEKLTKSLNSILNDQLDLKDPLFLITDNFQFLFQKLKKKLENTIKNNEVKNLKKEFKDLFGTAVAKEDKNYINDSFTRNLKRKSVIKLKNYNLSHIILEFSINTNKEQKTIINEIMIMMSEIFLEFLQYVESLSIDEAGKNLLELKKIYNGKEKDFERLIIQQVIKKNNEEVTKIDPNIMGHKYFEYKELENKYFEKFKTHWKLEHNISSFFFKFLRLSETKEINNLTMQIIYRLNNQQKIYYDNISNYVIFYSESDFKKFLKIKNIFVKMSDIIKKINLVKRLDKSIFNLYNDLSKLFEELIKNLYNEKKWKHDHNILVEYENIKFEDDEDDESNDKSSFKTEENIDNSDINNINLKENEEIIDTTVQPNNNNNKITNNAENKEENKVESNSKNNTESNLIKNSKEDNENDYYLSENNKDTSSINLLITQQTLYNLGFINLINGYFEYIEWIVNTRKELREDLFAIIEKILISIYKLLVLFIYQNNKHQTIIKEKLYLYICPLKLINKGQYMLYYLGYFILNLVYNFKNKNELNEIKNLDKIIYTLSDLHELEWINCKEIIPFYVESLKIIIEFAPSHYFSMLYQVLKVITNVIILSIGNKTETENDIISLKRILQLILLEQDKKSMEENRNTAILPLDTIIATYLNMIKLLILDEELDLKYIKLCKVFNLVTNLIYYHFPLYKGYFDDKIIYNRKLKKTLIIFCKKIKIHNSLIYNEKHKKNGDLRDFNEFLGLAIPKLYILLQITDDKNNIENENESAIIIGVANKFYKKLYEFISKEKSMNKEYKIFLSLRNEDEIIEILNNIPNDAIKYLEFVYDLLKNSLINNNKDEDLNDDDSLKPKELKFNEIWNKIQLEINYRQGLNKFQEIVKMEINKDRKKFVRFLFDFFEDLEIHSNHNIKNIKDAEKNLKPSISFYDTFFNCFKNFYSVDFINYKSELYFFYWSNIYIMQYNKKEKNFDYFQKTKYNKDYFNNLGIIEFTINQFSNINIFSNNYENLLYIKFFNSYLCELTDQKRAAFFMLLIEKQEAKNIFSLLQYILSELQKKIDLDIKEGNNKLFEKEEIDVGSQNFKKKEGDHYYSPHLFENDLDDYELALELISNLSENNDTIKGKMKDFLRMQYNNAKSHNFIVILASIIEIFVSDENPNNILLLEKYYSVIIKIIECITKCCNGASKENQDCVVKETKMLKFTKFILEKINYRQKLFFDDGINVAPNEIVGGEKKDKDKYFNVNSVKTTTSTLYERTKSRRYECQEIGLDRKRLSYLKYKLLLFLTVITVGRQKDDKIYELVHQVIDFNTLANILVETYKEILIEKNCTRNPELLSFDENMLQRMDNIEYKDLKNWNESINDENFIIFENGTYTYILINIYLENLSKPIDIDTYNLINKVKDILKIINCKENKDNIFSNIIDFCISIKRCFQSIYDCNKREKINEDFYMKNSFALSYKFFFEYTQNIEIIFNKEIIKYYVKLSPICKCLTKEIKEEFQSRVDRSSTKSKIECLFENIDFFEYQLAKTKIRLDIYKNHPILDLLFNQYNFYRDIFLILNALINILIFASYFQYIKEDAEGNIIEAKYRFGLFYEEKYIVRTENALHFSTMAEMIISFLVFINYIIVHIPVLTFYKDNNEMNEETNNEKINEPNNNISQNMDKYYIIKRIFNTFYNICNEPKLLFHLFLFLICAVSFFTKKYTNLIILLIDVVERSKILMCIVKSIWLPKMQILVTLFLFYLIAYFFSIMIYLFIPSQVPLFNCRTFRNCFFTLCDQTIKNSNGIINYLTKEGLYTHSSLWGNPRFYIDNWFAIVDTMLILQILAGIIIDNFISQREENDKIEKDKENKCFICGLKKAELNIYYNQLGFNEHIKLDHNLWNYVFCIFNIIKKEYRTLISIDLLIYESYKKKSYSSWVPYKVCKLKIEEDLKEEKNKDESDEDDDD